MLSLQQLYLPDVSSWEFSSFGSHGTVQRGLYSLVYGLEEDISKKLCEPGKVADQGKGTVQGGVDKARVARQERYVTHVWNTQIYR